MTTKKITAATLTLLLITLWFMTSSNRIETTYDYAQSSSWACDAEHSHLCQQTPTLLDGSAMTPGHENGIDVFFVHPSTHITELPYSGVTQWVTEASLRYEASSFGSARVFAPYYHLPSQAPGEALDDEQAYTDIKKAFEYYLAHHQNHRGFILAGHGEGARLLQRLLLEKIDQQPISQYLVAAYLIGTIIPEDLHLESVHACKNATDTHCIIAWNTVGRSLKKSADQPPMLCTNPLSWHHDHQVAHRGQHQGAWLYGEEHLRRHYLTARCTHHGLYVSMDNIKLQATQTPTMIQWLQQYLGNDYYLWDYAFFYGDIWKNVGERADSYLQKSEALKP